MSANVVKDEKWMKDGDKDISTGPIGPRGCTDCPFCVLFIAHIVLFWILTLAGFADGNPWKLVAPRDYKGNFCGVVGNTFKTDGVTYNVEEFPKLLMSMNTTSTFDSIAETLVCGSMGYNVLVNSVVGGMTMTDAEYRQACSLGADTSFGTEDAASLANGMSTYASDSVAKYSDPAQAAEFFTGGGSSAGTQVFSQAAKYFNMICGLDCEQKSQGFSGARTWMFTPNEDVKWKVAWDSFVSNIQGATGAQASALQATISKFNFQAWPVSVCPYAARYCIPMPGTDFTEVGSSGICMPALNSGIVGNAVNAAGSEALDGLARLSVTEDAEKGFGKLLGDILNSWDVLLIVGILAIVIGLLLLVLLRFFLGPAVYTVLVLIFVTLVAAGLAIFTKASQCADQSFSDAANSQKDLASSSAMNGSASGGSTNPFANECVGGYAVESQELRDGMTYLSYLVLGLAVVYLLFILCMLCRIRLAVKINEVAADFVTKNPMIILLPLIQGLLLLVWAIVWIFFACFLVSQVPEDTVGMGTYSYNDAYGNDGQCKTDAWPAGGVYKNALARECQFAADNTEPLCWKCSLPRFYLGPRFAYVFFSYLWQNGFVIAVAQCIIAGAVGVWFFTPREEKGTRPAIMIATKNALWWHSGSLALGSFILAVVQFLRWFMAYLKKQAEAQNNQVMVMICKVLGSCLWCFEKCVKFLNKNAYIQVALVGTNFCVSAKNAFFLILRNALRFAVICGMSFFVHFIGILFITVATAFVGYLILDAMHPEIDKIAPTFLYACIGYCIGKLFMSVFGMAVDATLQCFIATEELGAGGEFVPEPLRSFVQEEEGKGEGKTCCDYICPCCCGGGPSGKSDS